MLGVGIAAYFALPRESEFAATLLPLATGLVMWGASRRHFALLIVAETLIAGGTGFFIAKLRTMWVAAPVLEHSLRSAEVTGVLERLEPHAKRGARLTLRITAIERVEADRLPKRARIRVMVPVGDIRPGQSIRLRATLSPPAEPALPGGFDFARVAWFEGIGAVGFSLKAPEIVTAGGENDFALLVRAYIEDIRREISTRISMALPGERGALATALITGERGGIPQETTDAYRDSGLVHILSISGLHMVIMAGAVFASVRFILAAVPALALNYPIKKWAAFAGAAGAIFYYAISGGAAATLRAAIMMVVLFLAVMLGRPAIAMRNVAIAALIILCLIPESLLDVGFQMSFAAVVALVAAYEAVRRHFERQARTPGMMGRVGLFLGGIVFSTVIAGLAVTPLSIYHFHAMQHYAPLANLVAVPVCNLVVMPAALVTFVTLPFGLEAWPLSIMGLGLDVMGGVATHVAALPGAVTTIAQIPNSAFALALAGGLWLTLWQKPWRLAGLPVILSGIALASAGERPDILIGREGALIALRGPGGVLTAHAERGATFELKRWLEHDGDPRSPADARRGRLFTCDALGCVVAVAGRFLAVSRHPAGLADDCVRADILVINGARPEVCERPAHVLDRAALRTSGAVAFYAGAEGKLRLETVADARGRRPWTRDANVRDTTTRAALSYQHPKKELPTPTGDGDRLLGFVAPSAVADAFQGRADDLRPEIADEF
jgi:competence protein ComEC